MIETLKKLLEHPDCRGLELDAPETTLRRREIIRRKPFLRKIYQEFYGLALGELGIRRPVLEIGSGGGFLEELVPGLITSDVLPLPGLSLVLDGRRLPFEAESLGAVVMLDVLHHIPQPELFFGELERGLAPGGRAVLIEPWVSAWSRLIYRRLHSEPFQPAAPGWEIPSAGPLSGANIALPWIIFERDRARFDRLFPTLAVRSVRRLMPLRYLLSGGVSLRALAPGWSFGLWRAFEGLLRPLDRRLAMFALIVLEKIDNNSPVHHRTAETGGPR